MLAIKYLYAQNPSYGAAILVVRNPGDALVAEWNRLMSKNDGHTSQLGREAFGESVASFQFKTSQECSLLLVY